MKPRWWRNQLDRLLHLRRAEHGVGDALHARRPLLDAHQVALARQRRVAGVEQLARRRDLGHLVHAPDHLDLVAVRLGQADALAAARLVHVLDAGGAGHLGERLEIVLARGVIGDADELRLALLGDVEVMNRVGAAIVDRVVGLGALDQPEILEEFRLQVEIGRAQARIGDVGDLDDCHCSLTLDARGLLARPVWRGRYRSRSGRGNLAGAATDLICAARRCRAGWPGSGAMCCIPAPNRRGGIRETCSVPIGCRTARLCPA